MNLRDVALGTLVVGGLNWATIGAFNVDLVQLAFGGNTSYKASPWSRAVYGLVGASALYTLAASSADTIAEPPTRFRPRAKQVEDVLDPLD